MVATPGTRDVDNPARRLRTDLDLRIDSDKAALFGVAPVEVDRTVRAAVAGLTVGKFREADGDEYDITLRLPMQGRQTLAGARLHRGRLGERPARAAAAADRRRSSRRRRARSAGTIACANTC